MAEADKEIAESIRRGIYFSEARGWFQAVYIGPVSERSFFLIVAVLSLVVLAFSVIGLMGLTPVTTRQPILVKAGERADEIQRSLHGFDKQGGEYNKSILNFFLANYVQAREGYLASAFTGNARFIYSQSDEATYAAYAAANVGTNPESLVATLGEFGQRWVTVTSVRSNNVEGRTFAEVDFIAEVVGVVAESKTQWTAKIEYRYTELEAHPLAEDKMGFDELQVTDPHFQVISYVVEKKQ